MRRRDFIAAMGAAAGCLSAPHAVRAQQTTTRTIGWLSLRSADTSTEKSILAAFRQGLNQTGYVEGRNLTIEFRFADGHYDRLPALAADLVRRQVEVLMLGAARTSPEWRRPRRQQYPSFLRPPTILSKTASSTASTGRVVTARERSCSTLR